jgi:uncharacterized delta-60 repeat protein
MNSLRLLPALVVLLGACASVQPSVPSSALPLAPTLLGVLRVDLSGLGDATPHLKTHWINPTRSLSAQTLEYVNPARLAVNSGSLSFDDDEASGTRYVRAVLRLNNNTDFNLNNLTLYALSLSGTGSFDTLGGTAVSNLRDAAGNSITDPLIARAMQPTHGMQTGLGGVSVARDWAQLQAFSVSEMAQAQTLYNANVSGGTGKVLGYGFVTSNSTGGRSIRTSRITTDSIGQVALAYRLPLRTPRAQNPWSLSLYFVLATDTETSITQSLEEVTDSVGVAARATSVGATVVRTLVGSTLTDARAVSVCGGVYALNPTTGTPEKLLSDPALLSLRSGSPDFCAFGNRGWATTAIGLNTDVARAVAVQSDGKIVAVGFRNVGSLGSKTDVALVRYTSSGALDSTFGNAGVVVTTLSSESDGGNAVALQPDGKIVVTGSSASRVAVLRYTQSGALDSTFGSGGFVTTAIPDGSGNAVALQPDGKIVVAGRTFASTFDGNFAVLRYNSSGVLDSSFGSAGITTTSFGNFGDFASQVAIQPDGKVLVCGYRSNGSTYEWALARYTSSGALDSTFGTGGKVTIATNSATGAQCGMALASGGKIVLTGLRLINNIADFTVLRLTSSGALDATFGSGGIASLGSGVGMAVALQSDGKIVAAGFDDSGKTVVVRVSASGIPDATFGTAGVTRSSPAATAFGNGLAFQPDGKIVVAGASGSNLDFAVLRVIP